VVGALAYDQISRTDALLVQSGTHLLNCKLLDLAQAFGGCGGNIAYTLACLGSQPLLISCSGEVDDGEYMQRLKQFDIDARACLRVPGESTARAIIVTDPTGHQFTGFYPGPVPDIGPWVQHLRKADLTRCPVFIQAPYPPQLMLASLQYARRLDHRPLKIWCPGQYADQLEPALAGPLVQAADWIVGNQYEVQSLQRHTDLAQKLVIRTQGAEPVVVNYPNGAVESFKVEQTTALVDPTGCGDAFIAGFVHELCATPRDDWQGALGPAIASGCTVAASCLSASGSQNHLLTTMT
jgi:adenosine kinase